MAIDKAITTSAFAESVVVRKAPYSYLACIPELNYLAVMNSRLASCRLRQLKLSTTFGLHYYRPSYANSRKPARSETRPILVGKCLKYSQVDLPEVRSNLSYLQ